MPNPLKDKDFLKKLDTERRRTIYVRITSLNWQEQPIEQIEGRVTGGSINIDGASALRRTASLSMVTETIDFNQFNWSLNTKIKIEIGVENTVVDSQYPDKIWFPQGIYVLTTFNTSWNTNNYTISISAKDKMCLLNGDISGSLNASIDFGTEEYYDKVNNITTYTKIPIKDIILHAVNVYGGEPLENIVINDLDEMGYELLTYKGSEDTPLFLLRIAGTDVYTNMTMNSKHQCYVYGPKPENPEESGWNPTTIGTLNNYDIRANDLSWNSDLSTKIKLDLKQENEYTVCKIVGGETVGYRLTDLVYAGDLISKVGESLTSVLDKIKNMLGNFEYFYDVDGKFIFQKKKNNIYNNWNPLEQRDGEWQVNPLSTAIDYTFYNSELFTAISHTPALNNLKNDFSIWGERAAAGDAKLPIHLRYALDKKPTYYKSYDETNYSINKYDWRELIYQMAVDYFKHNQEYDFLFKIAENNPDHYPSGRTGYEQYYTDLQGFWRQLYNPIEQVGNNDQPDQNIQYYIIQDDLYVPVEFYGTDENKQYAAELQMPDTTNNITYYKDSEGKFPYSNLTQFNPADTYYMQDTKTNEFVLVNIYKFKNNKTYKGDPSKIQYCASGKYQYWNKLIIEDPSRLDFWMDFLDDGTAMDKYMVSAIGARQKSVNDNKVQAISFKKTPNVVFITSTDSTEAKAIYGNGYSFIQVNDYLNTFFNISSQGKSAMNVLEELLYENTYCSESINITSIPIYYLQPNTRISLLDSKNGISGEFIISKITIPLTYNGTMQISATRAADTIY